MTIHHFNKNGVSIVTLERDQKVESKLFNFNRSFKRALVVILKYFALGWVIAEVGFNRAIRYGVGYSLLRYWVFRGVQKDLRSKMRGDYYR